MLRRRPLNRRQAVGSVVVLAVIGALFATSTRPATPTPTPSATSTPTPNPTPPPGLKPDISGLLDRGNNPNGRVGGSKFTVPSGSWQSAISGFVVSATWADLQPTSNGSIVRPNIIDRAITAAGSTEHIKIRIDAGEFAPQWVKNLDGGPLATRSGLGIGLWWMPDYEAAYADLQAKLAAIYDNVPQISDVTISGCMTLYAEPLLKDDVSSSVLTVAGYTDAKDQACQQAAIKAHSVWRNTHQSFSFNPYAGLNGVDEAFTESLMDFCAQRLGQRCSLENNSIRYPNNPGFYRAMYAHMGLDASKYGLAVDFQTATLSKLNTSPEQGLGAALDWATGSFSSPVHASSVELPSGYLTDGTWSSPAAYAPYEAKLLTDPH